MANLGYILKQSVIDACMHMSDKDFKDTILGLFNYAANGISPNFDTPLQKVIFDMEKPSIDRNNEKWEIKRKELGLPDPMKSIKGTYIGRIEDLEHKEENLPY